MKLLESARVRLVAAITAGVMVALAAGAASTPDAALMGIAVAGGIFVASGWLVLLKLRDETQAKIRDEDMGRFADEVAVVGCALAGLGGVVGLLLGKAAVHGPWAPAIAVFAVFMAWAALHLMYATRYAHEYYDDGLPPGAPRAIDFNSGEGYQPDFGDFLYFSYNLGMTYQVSDTNLQTSRIRMVVVRHCLLSYVFGTAILATTINLVVGALAR